MILNIVDKMNFILILLMLNKNYQVILKKNQKKVKLFLKIKLIHQEKYGKYI